MSDDSALWRLAALAGIETRFRDVWGGERRVSKECVEALLAAIGLDVGTAESAAARARDIVAASRLDLCEPVTVAAAGAEFVVLPITVPTGAVRIDWQFVDEAGAAREGAAAVDELPHAEEAAEADVSGSRRRLLHLPGLPAGYYTLMLACDGREAQACLVVAPSRCYLPEELDRQHAIWGVATQLYALRSTTNWGIGDFSDLARLGEGVAAHGARLVGINPLHALFAAEPRHISPYSPSSRLFLNPLYIDVEAVPDFAECDAAQGFAALPETMRLRAAAREAALLDHAAVATLKKPALRLLCRCFRDRHLGVSPGGALTERGASFRAFQQAGGAALRRFAVFETLHETHLAAVADHSWRRWDRAFQDPGSLEVAQFAAAHCEQVEYAEYLQWEADRQLGEAARRGRDSGLSVGMYRDLAIGVDPHGADAWSDPELLVSGATVGAPPDQLNLNGQNWGLAPVNPLVLHRRGYAPFIAGLRANMRHAGILRIDHVMGLQHLYWVPHGAKPTEGAYIRYPFDDLMGVLALESHRQRCAIIGEDLGTVPDGFRERMQEANVLCCRVLLFERRDDGSFIPPDQYPASAAASVGTHDVATFKGYWTGHDLDWRRTLNLYPTPEQREADEESRIGARRSLLDALAREGLLPPDLPEMRDGEFSPALSEAVHRFLGRSAARLVMVQIEDLLGEIEQVNLPGTLDEHPNWRRKLSRTIEDLLRDENFLRLAKALNKARAGER